MKYFLLNTLIRVGRCGPIRSLRRSLGLFELENAIARLLEPKSGRVVCRLDGYDIELDLRDRVVAHIIARFKIWEPGETALLKSALQPQMTFVDIGANVGYFSLLAAKAEARVFAFEPNPLNQQLLESSIARNKFTHVTLFKCALSDHTGTATLHSDRNNFGSPSLALANVPEPDGEHTVSLATLDESLPPDIPVDIIKIDVQGAEAAVFRGARDVIERSPNLRILMEFWPKGIRNCGDDPQAMLEQLVAVGFTLQRIPDDRFELIPCSCQEALQRAEENDHINLWLTRTGGA